MKPKLVEAQHLLRPMPPPSLFEDDLEGGFKPAPEVREWVQNQILSDDGHLYNEDHLHLLEADLHFLWTSVGATKQGMTILGTAEMPMFRGSAWQAARQEFQMREWFGRVPEFLITLQAGYCLQCTDLEFAMLVEHELYHCAHAFDEYGAPKFKRDGSPKMTIRGHDIEEFVGVVRRYGVTSPAMQELVERVKNGPEVAAVHVARACGTCMLKVV